MKTLHLALAAVRQTVGAVSTNLERTLHWAEKARGKGADLVCFPELNLTGYSVRTSLRPFAQPVPGPATEALQAAADRLDLAIVAGMAEADPGGKVFASQVLVRPGRAPAVYRKLHVAPPEREAFRPGDAAPTFGYRGVRIGIQLCYDAHFPGLSTRMALEGIDLLLVPHASPRGVPAEKLASWQRHLPARAFDNGIFVAACNPVGDNGDGLEFPGVTVAFGPDGRRLAASCHRNDGLLSVRLEADRLERVRRHPMGYFLPHRREDVDGG